jgi:putative hydrolase of the HAD superfamily
MLPRFDSSGSDGLPLRGAVKAVLFDAVGTLIAPNPSVARAYYQAGQRYGSRLDEATIETRFRAAMAVEEQADAELHRGRTSQAREQLRWRRIVTHVFDDIDDHRALFADLWDHFGAPANWRLYDEVPAVWMALAERGFTLGVASNFDERLETLCSALAPLNTSCHVLASSRLGWRKPSLEFFRAIEQRLDLRPEQFLLVGDDPILDFNAARAAGWHALLVNRSSIVDRREADSRHLRALADLPAIMDV